MKLFRRNFSALVIIGLFAFVDFARADYFTFWANNNIDRSKWSADDGTNIDDDIYQNSLPAAGCPFAPNTPTPDCEYRDASGNRVIPCKRDLLDFTRLWLAGVNELVHALPTNSTITLSWTAYSGEPAIDLFTAIDPGIGYLTNDTMEAAQIDPVQCPYLGRISPTQTVQFTKATWRTNQFIFCGVNYGYGGLTMTINDGNGQQLVQTTTWIQIVDIKQMYERWTVGDRPKYPPTNIAQPATEGLGKLPDGTLASATRFTAPQDTNTPYILFVHGWNLETWEKDRYAESAFKRLYWQGYKGRFGEFRWPTDYDFGGIGSGAKNTPLNDPQNFDRSESNAWASATGLLNKLNDLNAVYPGHIYLMAHSMGNVVVGEALRLAGNNQVANTYIAMQGAIASHAYDPNTPTRSLGIQDSATPNRYANYWTNGAPCYFNNSAGAGTYLNFYNTNDYALSALLWQLDQNAKPDFGYVYDGYNGTFFRGTIVLDQLFFPTNTYELFAYCDEARCYALGAQADVNGVFSGQQNLQGLWLTDPLHNQNFSSHFWHSAEFRGDYPAQINFWRTLLGRNGFNLK
jgi:hypothetical protein